LVGSPRYFPTAGLFLLSWCYWTIQL
jgi:hypothetical protein